MEFFKKQLNIYLYKIIVVVVLFAICLLLVIYLNSKASSPFTPLLGGLSTGLIVALLQLLLMWTEHNEMEKIKKLGIQEILPYRDDEIFYRKVIEKTKEEIRVLGSTASRFMMDFADESREDKMALINALDRKVHVKFLLPETNCLWNDEDKSRAEIALNTMRALKKKYKDLIECKHYSHKPFHNLVLADDNCFVGPIFPSRTSKNTPTIYTYKNSIFANSYLEYYDYEWENAKSCL
ncbi:MAG: hypothetical protein WC476_07005 [Phycisphaerae bacterium]|jgi:hypothetical protein